MLEKITNIFSKNKNPNPKSHLDMTGEEYLKALEEIQKKEQEERQKRSLVKPIDRNLVVVKDDEKAISPRLIGGKYDAPNTLRENQFRYHEGQIQIRDPYSNIWRYYDPQTRKIIWKKAA